MIDPCTREEALNINKRGDAGSNATLHAHPALHPDSEEAVRHERRRVAKELQPLHQQRDATSTSDAHATPSFASLRSHDASRRSSRQESEEDLRRQATTTSRASTQPDIGGEREHHAREAPWYQPIVKFWTTHISLTIDDGAHRDHLALERTFLGYLRTSLILLMTGVITAQLFRLEHAPDPDPTFGFYVIGRPLSVTFIGMAIVVVIVGAVRFWRLQTAIVRGKAYAGGWEVLLVMGLNVMLLLGTFALVVGVDIEKSYFSDG